MACTDAPTPGQTLDVYNDQHRQFLSVTDSPQADTVTVREYNSGAGAQTGVFYPDGSIDTRVQR